MSTRRYAFLLTILLLVLIDKKSVWASETTKRKDGISSSGARQSELSSTVAQADLELLLSSERKLRNLYPKASTSSKSSKAPTVKSTKSPTIKSTKSPTIKSCKSPTIKSTKAPSIKSTKATTSTKSSKAPSVFSGSSKQSGKGGKGGSSKSSKGSYYDECEDTNTPTMTPSDMPSTNPTGGDGVP